MKKILMILFLVAGYVVKAQEINDPNAQVRKVSNFHAIEIQDGIDLYLSQSGTEALAVSAASAEIRDAIKAEVQNGVLKISFSERGKLWNRSKKNLKAYVAVKELDRLIASGASDVVIAGELKSDKLEIHMNGASDIKGKVNIGKLNLKLSGASDATLSGKVVDLNVDANGASDLKGYDLETDNCTAEASGASDIKVTVNKELNAKASGASDVSFRGSGVIREIKSSGASSISKKG